MRLRPFLRFLVPALVVSAGFGLALAVCAAPAGAVEVSVLSFAAPAVEGWPALFQRASVNAYVPARPAGPRVVLVSGWTTGAGWLHWAADYLARAHGLEVWTVNRRWTLLEDRARLASLWKDCAEGKTAAAAWRAALADQSAFARASLAPLKDFGLVAAVADLHVVVKAAGRDGRGVVLGGWSDGVEYTMAYALAEAERGKRGHAFLRGIAFFDENPEWGRTAPGEMRSLEAATRRRIAGGDLVESRAPNVLFWETAGLAAGLEAPGAGLFGGRPYGDWRWTGRALVGWLFGGAGSTWSWLASTGRPLPAAKRTLDWSADGAVPAARLVELSSRPGGAWEWFYPLAVAADYWELGADGFKSPDRKVAPDAACRLPVRVVLSSFNWTAEAIPAGIRWWLDLTGVPRGRIAVQKAFDLKHGDLLLAPRAEAAVWKPFAHWVLSNTAP